MIIISPDRDHVMVRSTLIETLASNQCLCFNNYIKILNNNARRGSKSSCANVVFFNGIALRRMPLYVIHVTY